MMCFRGLSARRRFNPGSLIFCFDCCDAVETLALRSHKNSITRSVKHAPDLERIDTMNCPYIQSESTTQWPSEMLTNYSYPTMVTELAAKYISTDMKTRDH